MTRRHINKQKHQFFNILFLNYKLTETSKFDNDKELEKSRQIPNLYFLPSPSATLPPQFQPQLIMIIQFAASCQPPVQWETLPERSPILSIISSYFKSNED